MLPALAYPSSSSTRTWWVTMAPPGRTSRRSLPTSGRRGDDLQLHHRPERGQLQRSHLHPLHRRLARCDPPGREDFSAVIAKAQALEGFKHVELEHFITIGFARNALMQAAPAVIDKVKAGEISHFFLVGM